MTLQEDLEELYELKRIIESRVFQKYLAKPLREIQDNIQSDFFSDSLKESWKKGGKIEGIEEFFKLLDIGSDIKNKKDSLESQV